ncbi:MAG: enoyl-CoA hydratase-related protein [Cyclobacteriaceae bacterium]|nr:methylglutaconyl-CoA hydratase [Cytophagales bacterium]HNP78934.1 enoyl-CoA hydratase-related protein [Cyclobacteriaceae bacterium]
MAVVEYEVTDRIGTITLNRPEKRNALSPGLIQTLHEIFLRAEQDDRCKVIVLRAEGEAFCSGADLGYLQQLQQFTVDENLEDSRRLRDLLLLMYRLKKVIIAEVQGSAIAGGCGLMTVCDFAFTVPDAKFGYTEVRIGFVPALVSVFLIRKIGEARARQLLLTGKLVAAAEAHQMGLITEVVAPEKLSTSVRQLAASLIKNVSAASLQLTRRLIDEVQNYPLEEALERAAKENAIARGTDDCKKGVASFLNKQPLSW